MPAGDVILHHLQGPFVAADCWQLLSRGVEVNQLIVRHKLQLPVLDLAPIHAVLRASEDRLKNLEVGAAVARLDPAYHIDDWKRAFS